MADELATKNKLCYKLEDAVQIEAWISKTEWKMNYLQRDSQNIEMFPLRSYTVSSQNFLLSVHEPI